MCSFPQRTHFYRIYQPQHCCPDDRWIIISSTLYLYKNVTGEIVIEKFHFVLGQYCSLYKMWQILCVCVSCPVYVCDLFIFLFVFVYFIVHYRLLLTFTNSFSGVMRWLLNKKLQRRSRENLEYCVTETILSSSSNVSASVSGLCLRN